MNNDKYVERTINQSQYGLTFEQQELIEESVDNNSIRDLACLAFKDKDLDERSMEYHNVRRFVAKVKRGVPTICFTDEQLEFIQNNVGSMKPFEMAKTLFPKKKIVPLSKETQTISAYLEAIGDTDKVDKSTDYRPPKSANAIARKINKADSTANYNADDLSPFQSKCIESLRKYLQSVRYLALMNTTDEPELRDLFEEEFIKGVHDKPDLNTEELNMYITLCYEYVNLQRLEKQKAMLSSKIDECIEDADSDDTHKKKLFYTWVEMYKEREEALHKAKTRAERLQKNLSDTRAARLKAEAGVNESLARFVEVMKSEEDRKRLLIIAESKKAELEEEMDKMESYEEFIGSVRGVSRDEILYN